ncbi:hypothetical protein [Jidongwangia harbinensis]|uniref:hypothetical protein n=1 Tax=Jidongwangia harbinensis TaxID=2878561 RepID=UPI001CD9747B|nr:hypothetical protein [Jidongwangia harbinensis]MCA2215374.1 hypothetical protein [Jidongwangia harbinensis]
MRAVVPFLVFAVALGTVLAALAWLAARTRRRGVGRELMGPVDLLYRPHTHQLNQEIRQQEQQMVAMPPAEGGREPTPPD